MIVVLREGASTQDAADTTENTRKASRPFFRATVEEETKAAAEIAGLIEPVTKTYLDLTLSGSKSDS
ncbi:hypothetical protein ACQKJ1_25925 [Methylorubrum rhodesianum]|uniref:hypothetical protein n=1 Tax=Methylorubrum rhodesianum TaxID=29427 RepID=UPI003D02A41A